MKYLHHFFLLAAAFLLFSCNGGGGNESGISSITEGEELTYSDDEPVVIKENYRVTIDVEAVAEGKSLFITGDEIVDAPVEEDGSAIVDGYSDTAFTVVTDQNDNIIFLGDASQPGVLNASTTTKTLLLSMPFVAPIVLEYGYDVLLSDVQEVEDLENMIADRVANSEASWSDPEDTDFVDQLNITLNAIIAFAETKTLLKPGYALKGQGGQVSVQNQLVPRAPPEPTTMHFLPQPIGEQSGISITDNSTSRENVTLGIKNSKSRHVNVYVDGQKQHVGFVSGNSYDGYTIDRSQLGNSAFVEIYGLGSNITSDDFDFGRSIGPIIFDFGFVFVVPFIEKFIDKSTATCIKNSFGVSNSDIGGFASEFLSNADFKNAVRSGDWASAGLESLKIVAGWFAVRPAELFGSCAGSSAQEALKKYAIKYAIPIAGKIVLTYDITTYSLSVYPTLSAILSANVYEKFMLTSKLEKEYFITREFTLVTYGSYLEQEIGVYAGTVPLMAGLHCSDVDLGGPNGPELTMDDPLVGEVQEYQETWVVDLADCDTAGKCFFEIRGEDGNWSGYFANVENGDLVIDGMLDRSKEVSQVEQLVSDEFTTYLYSDITWYEEGYEEILGVYLPENGSWEGDMFDLQELSWNIGEQSTTCTEAAAFSAAPVL